MSQPAPDSRVERFAVEWANRLNNPASADVNARYFVEVAESAGLLVLDPKSEALVERITDALWMHVIFRDRNDGRDAARAVVAALGDPS
jgi:hypothetical protein